MGCYLELWSRPCLYQRFDSMLNYPQVLNSFIFIVTFIKSDILHILTLLMLETEYFSFRGQYHACRCLGSWSRQSISRHGIGCVGQTTCIVVPELISPYGIIRLQWVNSWAPGRCGNNFKSVLIFQDMHAMDSVHKYFLWNISQVNDPKHFWW